MPTDDHIWKMLNAWYQLKGQRIAPTATKCNSDFVAMKRHLQAFERETLSEPATG